MACMLPAALLLLGCDELASATVIMELHYMHALYATNMPSVLLLLLLLLCMYTGAVHCCRTGCPTAMLVQLLAALQR
jgi:hypothetical protein